MLGLIHENDPDVDADKVFIDNFIINHRHGPVALTPRDALWHLHESICDKFPPRPSCIFSLFISVSGGRQLINTTGGLSQLLQRRDKGGTTTGAAGSWAVETWSPGFKRVLVLSPRHEKQFLKEIRCLLVMTYLYSKLSASKHHDTDACRSPSSDHFENLFSLLLQLLLIYTRFFVLFLLLLHVHCLSLPVSTKAYRCWSWVNDEQTRARCDGFGVHLVTSNSPCACRPLSVFRRRGPGRKLS